MQSHADVLTVYADYVCPFCYLGRRSLERYRETRSADLTIEWHPFDLRRHKRGPDGTIEHEVDDGKDDEYFERARQNVLRLREEYGADEMLDPDAVPRTVDSFDAQVASSYVQSTVPEHWPAFDEALYRAQWVEGGDIGDVDVLVDLADDVGVDGADVRAAVADDDRRVALRERFEEAHRTGISGVPTFVHDGRAARGAVPPDHLERLVEGA